jgi:peptide/nickel transport system substrate-binding protein
LTVALGADPAGLDPLLQTGLVEASVYSNIFDPLVGLDEQGRLEPALAESYRALDDRSWEFKLRPGVRFHNGEAFDSSSVRATIERMLDPESKSVVRAQLGAIDRVETPDAQTAIVVTKQPFAPLLAELSGLMMLPTRALAEVGQEGLGLQPIGTGPFRFVRWVRDDSLTLEAYESHWRGSPTFKMLDFRPIPDPATRLAALRAGQVDLMTNVGVDHVDGLVQQGIEVLEQPGIQTLYVRLHARKPPLDDVRVRRALVQAVNIDQIIAAIYQGKARRVNGPFPPEVFGYDAQAAAQAYDPDQSRALLREAGLADSLALTFEVPQGRYPAGDQVAQAVAEQLGRVGVQVNLRFAEWGAYLSKVQAGQGEHLFLLAGTNRTFDPHFTITRIYANASPFGMHYLGNQRVDSLAAEAAASLDPERRRQLYGQTLELLRAEAPAIWLAQLSDLYAAQSRLSWTPRTDSLLWMFPASLAA